MILQCKLLDKINMEYLLSYLQCRPRNYTRGDYSSLRRNRKLMDSNQPWSWQLKIPSSCTKTQWIAESTALFSCTSTAKSTLIDAWDKTIWTNGSHWAGSNSQPQDHRSSGTTESYTNKVRYGHAHTCISVRADANRAANLNSRSLCCLYLSSTKASLAIAKTWSQLFSRLLSRPTEKRSQGAYVSLSHTQSSHNNIII